MAIEMMKEIPYHPRIEGNGKKRRRDNGKTWDGSCVNQDSFGLASGAPPWGLAELTCYSRGTKYVHTVTRIWSI
jgi:hypothetical protein